MTRTVQYFAVIAILSACLAVTAFGAAGGQAFRRSPTPGGPDAAALARLDDVEPALTPLLESARRCWRP